ncbi:MAG TPA: hypothetical protein VGM82_12580 [Gemmatimonadaceae bacterium]|jgi:hypothetical protein
MTFRRLLGLALIAGMPGIARAQFTTFIPPVNKTADSIKAVAVVQQKVQQDSVATAQMTNMKTWVDSAAGIVPTPTTSLDSANSVMPRTAAVTTTTLDSTTTFVNGTRAPATASSLPLLLLIGLGFFGAGAAVLFGAPRREPARVRARSRRV